jgi:hypothetical protein
LVGESASATGITVQKQQESKQIGCHDAQQQQLSLAEVEIMARDCATQVTDSVPSTSAVP